MKRIIFVLIFGFCVTSVFSQGKDANNKMHPVVPDLVLKGFIKNYGDAKATWEVKEGNYEATFKLNGMKASAVYDPMGHRMSVVVEIKTDQLPAIALAYIDRNYPKTKITKATKLTDDKKVNLFEAEIKIYGESKNLLFNSRGDMIKDEGRE